MNIDKQLDEILEELVRGVNIEIDPYPGYKFSLSVSSNHEEAKSALKKLINEARIEELGVLVYFNDDGEITLQSSAGNIFNRLMSLKEGKDI